MVCITALSLPSMMEIIAASRLRSSMSGLGGLLQLTRSNAIRTNQFMSVHFTTVKSRPVAFMKVATGGTSLNEKDQQQWFEDRFLKTDSPSGGPPLLDPTIMWNGLTSDPLRSEDPSFNPRGLPCLYDAATGVCKPNVGFVYYFSYNAPIGHTKWAALGISPAGRVKSWYWNGTKWGD